MSIIAFLFGATLLVAPRITLAHCPLCTAGAGIVAVLAAYLGISGGPIGVFIGAFAIALGLWIGNLIKKKYIPYQKEILAIISFATTVLPLLPLMDDYSSIYISFAGEYGALLNRVYLINTFLVGSIVGGLSLFISPLISKKITKLRNGKIIPFQGLGITFIVLLILAVILELIL